MKNVFTLMLIQLFTFYVLAQKPTLATDNALQSTLDSNMHQLVSKYLINNCIAGVSIGVVSEGKRHFYNYGTTEVGKQELPDKNTVYEIGSITKTFTGILLANAVLNNKIDLQDDIRKYLNDEFPNLHFNEKPIRIVHLANHSSGLPEDIIPEEMYSLKNPTMFDIVNLFEGDSGAMFKKGLKKVKPVTEPGTVIKYSNTGIDILGMILENVYNSTYSELLKLYIAQPLNLSATETVLYSTDTTSYTKGYDGKGNIMPHITWQIAGASGGLKSTANDLLNYLDANIKEKSKAIKLSHKQTINKKEQAYGLGWQIKRKDNQIILWHNGGEPGFSSYCLIIPEKEFGIVYLANQRGLQYEFSEMCKELILNFR